MSANIYLEKMVQMFLPHASVATIGYTGSVSGIGRLLQSVFLFFDKGDFL